MTAGLDSFKSKSTLDVAGKKYTYYNLGALAAAPRVGAVTELEALVAIAAEQPVAHVGTGEHYRCDDCVQTAGEAADDTVALALALAADSIVLRLLLVPGFALVFGPVLRSGVVCLVLAEPEKRVEAGELAQSPEDPVKSEAKSEGHHATCLSVYGTSAPLRSISCAVSAHTTAPVAAPDLSGARSGPGMPGLTRSTYRPGLNPLLTIAGALPRSSREF